MNLTPIPPYEPAPTTAAPRTDITVDDYLTHVEDDNAVADTTT
ncbi:hypothetical protein [Nocardia sp. NPDC058114]